MSINNTCLNTNLNNKKLLLENYDYQLIELRDLI